jgi:hypothetical protein
LEKLASFIWHSSNITISDEKAKEEKEAIGMLVEGKRPINKNIRLISCILYFSALTSLFGFFYNFSNFNVFEPILLIPGIVYLMSALAIVMVRLNKILLMTIAIIVIISGIIQLYVVYSFMS